MHKRKYRYTFGVTDNLLDMDKNNLNKNEESVMKILWKLEKAFLKEVLNEFPEPKIPSTTLASIIKKLESKGLVNHHTFNKSHQYYPLMKEEEYTHRALKSIMSNYFESSMSDMFSFFVKKENIDMKEIDRIYKEIKKQNSSKN